MVSNAELQKLITQFQDEQRNSNKDLGVKLDTFGVRLDNIDQRLNKLDDTNITHARKLEELEDKIDEIDARLSESLTSVINRVAQLEMQLQRAQVDDIPDKIRQLQSDNSNLKEELESRTNRQLRRTLIFKNIPETKEDESYSEVKALLTDVITSETDIPREEVFNGIERSHRESKRNRGREGKRKIFAAFLNWELPQRIIEQFRKRNIGDNTFQIYVDQMYGPLTTMRRNLAFQKRKALKGNGEITSGFVNYPARLMVNFRGDVDVNGKKIYKQHTDFSSHKVPVDNE